MSYIDDAFDKLKSNLEITQTESNLAQTRHQLVRDHIEGSWQLVDHFLTGQLCAAHQDEEAEGRGYLRRRGPGGPSGLIG